jgi:hypothetical protein
MMSIEKIHDLRIIRKITPDYRLAAVGDQGAAVVDVLNSESHESPLQLVAEYQIPAPPSPSLRSVTNRYSIRVPDLPGLVACEVCDRQFAAEGPTGHLDETPICDLCLLELESQLGMVLALVSVVRSFSQTEERATAPGAAAVEVLAFSKIYGRFADRFGAPRPFNIWWKEEKPS